MAIMDYFNEFSDAQAVTSTAISTNVIDLGPVTDNATRDLGIGDPLWLVIQTNTACTDAGDDATVAFTLETADNEALSSNAVVHYTTGALAFAVYKDAGTTVVCVRLPSGNYKRYMGVRYTVASGPLTAGKFDAFLTHDVQKWAPYARRGDIATTA